MKLKSIINMPVFIASLCIGLLFIFIKSTPTIIYVYPTPYNIDKVEYKTRQIIVLSLILKKFRIGNNIKTIPIQK